VKKEIEKKMKLEEILLKTNLNTKGKEPVVGHLFGGFGISEENKCTGEE